MKKPALWVAFLLLGHIFAVAQVAEKSPALLLRFDTDRSELTDTHKSELDQMLAALPGLPVEYEVTITGHTDARGSDAYNQNLSLRRGKSVSDYLAGRGFLPEKITLAAQGEHRPAADNATEQGMILNRRVEVRFMRSTALSHRPSDLVPEMKVHFAAERGITFASPISGSRVQIPGGVLVYADGSPVTGEVELRYREWRNLYEYLSFGQSMHYSDGRGDFFFNSNGMFEVQAYQKGEALGVAPGKNFTVSFVQSREMSDVNLYRYDQKTGQWAVAPTNGSVKAQLPAVLTALSVEAANSGFGKSKCTPGPIRLPPNVRAAESMADAVQTGYEIAKGTRRIPTAYLQDPLQDDTALIRQSERTPIRLHQYDDVKSYFYIDDLQQGFAELELVKNYKWEYVPSLMAGEFTREHLDMPWQAVYLSYDADNNLYDVSLVSTALKLEIKARLFHPDGRAVSREENPPMFRKYKSIQKERWDSKLTEIAALRRFLSLSMPIRPEDELCMSPVDWLKYFVADKAKMVDRYAAQVAIDYRNNPDAANELLLTYNQRCRANLLAQYGRWNVSTSAQSDLVVSLEVFSFGIYNCDQIFRLGEGTQVLAANFRTRDGKIITSRLTNVIEKTSQMMLSAPSPNQIFYSPSKTFDVVVQGQDGRTYLMRESEFAALPLAGRTSADLVLEDITDQVKSPKDWLKILGI